MLDDSDLTRVLVVMAHPDDVDFGAAGTVAQWTDAGVEVTYCIVTDGDAGGFDPAVPRNEIGGIRRAEQKAAGAEVGVSDVRFLGYPDGRLEPTLDVRRDISRVIREVRPQRVVCQSPQRNMLRIYASHPDHLAAGEAALCAVYPDARNPFTFPDLAELEAWSVSETWVLGMEQSNHYVDITDTFDRKMAALRAHASQHPDPAALDGLMRGWNGGNAAAGGLPEGRLAEAFWVLETA
ncbi:MAG: PIG-L family deacetylase [Frankiales bacterium]|nr:PIG-L family deacetylase [Frankiales bacterium]